MDGKRLFSVSAFARLSRVTPVMLHHYDKMKLLSPVTRGENGYRYYSIRQLSEVNLIRAMQDLGMSLREIRALNESRTPERIADMLKMQIEKLDEKVRGLHKARRLISSLLDSILSARDVDESSVTIRHLTAEPVLLGEVNEYGGGEDAYDALVAFYSFVARRYPDVDLNRPVWGLFTGENLNKKLAGEHTLPERYYFYSPEGRGQRPAGLYATGYARGGYGQNDGLYVRLKEYIDNNGFEILGSAYEEYPLNEICIPDDSNYLMRVMIAVREKPDSA